MNTADLQAFNDGFDYAVNMMVEANSRGIFTPMWVVSVARGVRHDRWWREGTDAAIEWAMRLGRPEKIVTYRDKAA